jgi:hypothetical protein
VSDARKTIKLGFDGVGGAGEKSFEYAQTIIHPSPGAGNGKATFFQ